MSILEKIGLELIWFDSMGAKSSSLAIKTSKGYIVIDPGAAAMQPSYPLSSSKKRELRRIAIKKIAEYVRLSSLIIITHYHYDHHFLPIDKDIDDPHIFSGKKLCIKNPNKYINESQWNRSRKFINEILKQYNLSIESFESDPLETVFPDPVQDLEIALSKDYGDYMKRREEILLKGRKWFNKLVDLWSNGKWLREIRLNDNTEITWCDGKYIDYGDTELYVLDPWFHGIEYDRTGWVTPVIIKKENFTIFYSSDLMGPIIEDYADYVIKLDPDIIVLDGPPTYLFPYLFNRINLQRSIDNLIHIIQNITPDLIIYDHHLLREKKWRTRVKKVFEEAKKHGVLIITASEYFGNKPLIDTL